MSHPVPPLNVVVVAPIVEPAGTPVSVTVWLAGAGPFWACENVNEVAEAVTGGPEITSVTGMFCVGTFGDVLLITIDPLYVPGCNPVGFNRTCRFAGVEPAFGDTSNQVRPGGFVAAVAVKFSGVNESVLVSEIFCEVNVVVPDAMVALTAAGLTLMSGVVLTFTVTGMFSSGVEEPTAVAAMLPVHVVAAVKPVRLALTISCAACPVFDGVIPVVGETLRKFPQFVLVAATLNVTGAPVLFNVIVWLCGCACPIWKLNVAEGWLAVNVALLLTVRVTGNVCTGCDGLLGELTLTLTVYVPGASDWSTAALMPKVRVAGCEVLAFPVVGVTVRKFGPPAVAGAVVTLKLAAAPELVI